MPTIISKTLHAVVLLGLISVTIWDIWLITNTYIYDNRVTLVTWERINDTYPFLQDTTMKIEVMNPHSLFSEFWNSEIVSFKDATEFEKERLEDFEPHFNKSSILPPEERYAVSQVLLTIHHMDFNAQVCMLGPCDDETYHSFHETAFLQRLLQNRQYLIDLETVTGQFLKWSIISTRSASDANFFTLDYLAPVQAAVSMNLSAILSPMGSQLDLGPICLGNVRYDQNMSITNPYEKVAAQMRLIVRDFKSDFIELSIKESSVITVTINNNGIFDRTETTSCKDEPYIHLLDSLSGANPGVARFKSEPCKLREFMETVVHFCQCIPFIFRHQYTLVSETIPDQEKMPFCTSQIYLNCMDPVRNAFSESKKKCLPLCTESKNQYIVSVSKFSIKFSKDGSDIFQSDDASFWTMADFNVECHDQIYGLYTEKFQLTLQQFISQLGGDIGLYTGFSILGFWQCLVFIYNICKTHAMKQKQDTNGPMVMIRLKNILSSIFQPCFGGANLETDFDDREPENSSNTRTQESISADVENEQKVMKSEIADLQARVISIQEGMALMRYEMVKLREDLSANLVADRNLPNMVM